VEFNTAPLIIGSTITIRATTPGYDTRYFTHDGTKIVTEVTTTANSTAEQETAERVVRQGLGFDGCYSFGFVEQPGNFIRHYGFELYLESGNEEQFFEDATSCSLSGLEGQNTNLIRSWSCPTRFFRHYADIGYIATEGGVQFFDATGNHNYNTSFVVSNGFLSGQDVYTGRHSTGQSLDKENTKDGAISLRFLFAQQPSVSPNHSNAVSDSESV
jgi:hypothetical protein